MHNQQQVHCLTSLTTHTHTHTHAHPHICTRAHTHTSTPSHTHTPRDVQCMKNQAKFLTMSNACRSFGPEMICV